MSALLKGRLGNARYSKQIAAALSLAYRGHNGQFREQADPTKQPIPYIAHPVGVALLAAEFFPQVHLTDDFDEVISACLTHDLLEDTDISPYELERTTSRRTLELVTALSRPSSADYASREDRNIAFLDAIKNAGRTAVFIKTCDSLHNLSRPEQTPLRLLKKTVWKGRNQYLDLIQTSDLGENLLARYRTRLGEIEELVSRAPNDSFDRARYADLDAVFTYCREKAKRKVLETHDIVEILKEVTGAHDVLYTSLPNFVANFGPDPIDEQNGETPLALRINSGAGEIPLDALPEAVRVRIPPATRILAISPKTFGSGDELFLVLVGPKAPHWVSDSVLALLITFLLERALLHEAGRVTEMADLIRAKGLDLDPHLALEAGLTGASIAALAHQIKNASVVKSVLDLVLSRLPPNMETRIERRESRVKASESIIRKTRSKKVTAGDLEDLVGYRFVVRNATDKATLTRFLAEIMQEAGLTMVSPPAVKAVRTPGGYVADHILFAVRIGLSPERTVPVEIQVRTILEDAWARVSQTIDYKKNNVVVRRNDKILKKLRDMIDEIEKEL
jgi:ppGpp synthetase/RelA/SpoT-type nucleotidyltranferase